MARSGGFRSFRDKRVNGEVAPIPAVRGGTIGRPEAIEVV